MSLVWDASALLLVSQDPNADPRAAGARKAAMEAADHSTFAAPALIDYELAQVVFVKHPEAFGKDVQGRIGCLNRLMRLIEVRVPAWRLTDAMGRHTTNNRLSAYDAAYLATAETLGGVLVTEDNKMRSAAHRILGPDRVLNVKGLQASLP